MLPLGKRDGPKDSVHPVQIAEPSPSDPTEFPGEEEVMRIKTCFVWSGLTCPGVLLHPCAACRSTLLGKSIHSQAGHPQDGTSNPLPPKILAHERRRMDLSLPALAIVSYSICMRMRVGVFGEREREVENERWTFTHFWIHSAHSFQCLFFLVHGFGCPVPHGDVV